MRNTRNADVVRKLNIDTLFTEDKKADGNTTNC